MAAGNWDKFMLLMWKNWLLQWRHKRQTVLEILAPVVLCALLVIFRGLVTPVLHPEPIIYDSFPINTTLPVRVYNPHQYV